MTPLLSDEVVLDLGHFTTASLHHYLLGQRATEDEDYELAIREFRLGLVHDQSTSELYEALSDVLVRQGHFSRAVEALESGLGRVSNEDRLKVALLSLHWRLRDFEALVLVHSSIKNQELSMDVTILPMLVDALMWSKQFEAAERVVDAALSAGDSRSVPWLLALGGVLEDHADLKGAEKTYDYVLSLWPGSYDAGMGLVRIAQWRKAWPSAHENLLRLGAYHSDSPWLMLDLYEAANQSGDSALAQSYAGEAVRRAFGDPEVSAVIYHWLAARGRGMGQQELRDLLKSSPKRWAVREALLSSLRMPEQAEECVELVNEVGELAESHFWAVRCLLFLGRKDGAAARALRARDAGLEPEALLKIGLLLGRHQPTYEDSRQLLQQLFKEADDESWTKLDVEAELAHEWGDAEPVRESLRASVASGQWRVQDAIWQFHHGDEEKGRAMLEALLVQAPEDSVRLNALGFTIVEQESDLYEAEVLLRRAYRLDQDAGFIMDSLGWLFFKAGKLEDADTWTERALRVRPQDPEILYHRGQVLAAQGNSSPARGLYEKALLLRPAKTLARKIQRAIEGQQR